MLDPGERLRVDLTNALDVDTIVHWHGQIPSSAQDGVPDIPRPMLKPGEVRHGAGEPRWMVHCHHMPHLSTGMLTEFAMSA